MWQVVGVRVDLYCLVWKLQYGNLIAPEMLSSSGLIFALSFVISDFAEYRLGNVKASDCDNWMDRQAIVKLSGVDQWEPCQMCTMSGSGTVTSERETTKLSSGVLTIDF